MDTRQLELLYSAGMNPLAVIDRFGGNILLYEHCLHAALHDNTCSNLAAAFEAGDYQAAFYAAHTLKGVAACLEVTYLYDICLQMQALLREEKVEQAGQHLSEVKACWQRVIQVITTAFTQ